MEASQSPFDWVFGVVNGFWLSRALHAAAKLGVADLVHEGPRDAEALAAALEVHGPSLYRLLRALAGAGVFFEDDDGRFHQTPRSEVLRTSAPGSLRATVVSELGEDHYEAWTDLLYSIRMGGIAFDQHFGKPVWRFYGENPENGAVFQQSMSQLTRSIEDGVVRSYDFAPFSRIVDVGGGHGTFLAAMLRANPRASGVLFDAPEVAAAARERLATDGLGGRCEAVGGDFFESAPARGDLYTLKWIIHDWDDAQSRTILANCHRAMGRGGRILLVEMVIPERNVPSISKLLDLNMLVMTGGRERTEQEYRELLGSAGFLLSRVIPTGTIASLVEGVRAVD